MIKGKYYIVVVSNLIFIGKYVSDSAFLAKFSNGTEVTENGVSDVDVFYLNKNKITACNLISEKDLNKYKQKQ